MNKNNNDIKLPFGHNRKPGLGEWIYRHRVGLLATVVVYLSIMIAFVSYKILIKPIPTQQVQIEIVEEIEVIEQQKQVVEQIESYEQIKIANRGSNENSKFDASLKDDRKTNTDQVYEEAERIQQELKAGQQAYQDGMAELASMQKRDRKKNSEQSEKASSGKDNKRQTAKVKGNVTVSYNLPNRNDVYLHVPAYQCEGGGEVIVNITVNQNGKVLNATVAAASSSADQCMLDMAVQAAKATSFNASTTAPDKQKGTITYMFVAQ